MKETFRLILALTGVCVASGLMLAVVRGVTEAPINKARRAEKLAALNLVLPEHDNDPYADRHQTADGELAFHVAGRNGALAGVAFEVRSHNGYGGDVLLLVGVTCSNAVSGVVVLEQSETPGLGARIADAEFISQFQYRNAVETYWCRLRQDSPQAGEIDAITGATISSRAVADAVARGLSRFSSHTEEILRTGERRADR
jgi:electron transport complex protein RnfG